MAGTLLAFALCAGPLAADEIKGIFQKINADRDTLTLTVRGEERTFPLSSGVKVLGLIQTPLKNGLESRLFKRPGVYLAVKTEVHDAREVVIEITLLRRAASPVYSKP